MIMRLGTVLVILLTIFLLGGFSGRFGGYGYAEYFLTWSSVVHAFLVLLAATAMLRAQPPTGEFRLEVKDPSGAATTKESVSRSVTGKPASGN